MSSLLNVSNDSRKPEEFSLKDIEGIIDSKEQFDLRGPTWENF